jgi:serine acetyltransferase/glycosyltransferase involved in cell wall biosynthesis
MSIGVVIIGRNEGERLSNCLQSLKSQLDDITPMVYVDSGSTDQSCTVARELGLEVIELDNSIPYTAARSRNTGFQWLAQNCTQVEYVQFIDGDCDLVEGWIDKAVVALAKDEKIAVVCGRRREKFPSVSRYNLLADMEWNTPIGEATFCGGDAMMRMTALKAVNGYNISLICGEEPEMCVRMRSQGWKIFRIDADMTRHDAAMFRFSQWWKRSTRGGWAVAEAVAMYGGTPERYMIKEYLSGWFWGLILPAIALGLVWLTQGLSLLLLLSYLILLWKIYSYRLQRGDSSKESIIYSFYGVLFKFPQVIGHTKYWLNRWQGKQATLIEYKIATKETAKLGLWTQIQEDWVAHDRDWTRPGFRAVAIHRFGVWRMNIKPKLLRAPLIILYNSLYRKVRNTYGIELPYTVELGRRVIIEHQHGIVIHGYAVIGDDSIIRQGVTIGNRYMDRPLEAPKIGARVNIGAGAKILGALSIGDDANIGANAVVLIDIPPGGTAVGIPAKLIPTK